MVVRNPRPRLYPRQKSKTTKLTENELLNAIMALKPSLTREASKIFKPNFIDNEDLVQEACLKMLKNYDKYDSEKASLHTWCMMVARKNFYNTALTAFRKDSKHTPDDHQIHVSFDVMPNIPIQKAYPHRCDAEWNIRYDEIVKRTTIRLKPFAKKIFESLLEPPEDLIKHVKESRIQKLRERRAGASKNVPFEFVIRNQHLAEYFDVAYTQITKAKDEINNAMCKAFTE